MDNIIEKARELAKLIQADPSYKALNDAREKNDNDAELQDLIGKFNLKRIELNQAMSESERDQDKINAVATKIYGADGVKYDAAASKALAEIEALDPKYSTFPICFAKTQYSLSDDASKLGRPEGFTITVREVRLSAGAEFIVVLTGAIMTMPGLPKKPAAFAIDVDDDGNISGLF